MDDTIQQTEVRSGLIKGGRLRSVVVITTEDQDGPVHHPFLHPSWRDGYARLATWKGRSERKYRDLDRLVRLFRGEFSYDGRIILYRAGDAALRRLPGLEPGHASAP